MSASASARSAFRLSLVVRTMFQPVCFRSSIPRSLILSATMTFMIPLFGVKAAGSARRSLPLGSKQWYRNIPNYCAEWSVSNGSELEIFMRGMRLCYSAKKGSENEPFRTIEERYCDRDEGERRDAAERPTHGKGGAAAEGSGKAASAGRDRIDPVAADAGEAAQGIHRPVCEGQTAGPGGQGKRGIEISGSVSAGGCQRGGVGRGNCQGHCGYWRDFDEADGRRGEGGEGSVDGKSG